MNLVLDGEASPPEKSEFEQHLQACSECRQQFQFYSQLRNLTRTSLSQESCPELVKARLQRMLAGEVKKAPQKRPVALGLGWVAAACAALFSFYTLRPSTDEATPLALSLSEDHSRCLQRPNSVVPQNPAYLAEQTFGRAMPEMPSHRELKPYDVRLCPVLQGQRAIHVLCKDERQRNVSVYTMPKDQIQLTQSSSRSPLMVDCQESRVASWEHKGWVFSLVSEAARDELLALAGDCSYGCPKESGPTYAYPGASPTGMPVQAVPVLHRP